MINLADPRLGSKVIFKTDDFFASANRIINPNPPIFKDGVFDRQLEYKRTIDFVDSRSGFLIKELEKIENSKQEFQEKNNLTDVKVDASMNVSQKYIYDGELFNAQQQKDLVEILSEVLSEEGLF